MLSDWGRGDLIGQLLASQWINVRTDSGFSANKQEEISGYLFFNGFCLSLWGGSFQIWCQLKVKGPVTTGY